MKGYANKLVSFLLAVAVLTSAFSFTAPGAVLEAEAAWGGDLHIAGQWTALETAAIIDMADISKLSPIPGSGVEITGEGALLPVDGAVEFMLDAPRAGEYSLVLEYKIATGKVLKNSISISWDGGEVLASVPGLWSDSKNEYEKDRYGNEVIPEQQMLDSAHHEYVKGFADLDKTPVAFMLKEGKNRFVLRNNTQALILSAVYLVKVYKTPRYSEYAATFSGCSKGSGVVIIEAEDYSAKTDSFIVPANVQDPSIYPYKTDKKLLNVLDGWSWKEAGQKVLWEFEIKTPGFYSIGFRYRQDFKEGMPVFRNIEIDGRVPFEELRSYPFKYTGRKFENTVLADDSSKYFNIWLDKGIHTIAMETDAGPIAGINADLKDLMFEINDAGIDIKKFTGNSKDLNRTWDIEQYMPGIAGKLEGWAVKLDGIYEKLKKISGEKPIFALNVKLAAKNLRELAKEPKKIPGRLTKLSEGSGSAAQLIGDFLTSLSYQPLLLDRICIFADEELPDADAGLLRKIWEGIKAFLLSFIPESRSYSVTANKTDDELSVWVNRPVQYVEQIQQLADSNFTPKTGISVKFSVMPNEQKLILANASRTNPDAAMSIGAHIPYELAIRGAVADLGQFDDFIPYISREYNLETLIPYCMDDKIYGVTETQDFFVLVYRKDIFEKLKIPVPETWEDIKEIMPELQRHSMNFFVPMAGWSGLKPFYTTAPFIFQNGGSIYAPDGLEIAINTEKSVKGFELMTELFSIYSVAENAPNFYNNFRYGLMPVGISNFNTYVMLMNAAPEIAGQWEIVPSPGVRDENGNILRYQVASERADIIFSNSNKKKEAWEMLKWWLSKETQIMFAYSMQNRYGPEYMWNTANMAAFEELPIPEKHKKVILEQWKWTKEVPRHPAGYMVEREISNAWTEIVMRGKNLRISIDKATLTANREIQRKLEEFGYIKDGKVIREYRMPDVEDIRKKVKDNK